MNHEVSLIVLNYNHVFDEYNDNGFIIWQKQSLDICNLLQLLKYRMKIK